MGKSNPWIKPQLSHYQPTPSILRRFTLARTTSAIIGNACTSGGVFNIGVKIFAETYRAQNSRYNFGNRLATSTLHVEDVVP